MNTDPSWSHSPEKRNPPKLRVLSEAAVLGAAGWALVSGRVLDQLLPTHGGGFPWKGSLWALSSILVGMILGRWFRGREWLLVLVALSADLVALALEFGRGAGGVWPIAVGARIGWLLLAACGVVLGRALGKGTAPSVP